MKKNNSESQSFRRKKVIEEMAPQRRAEALASSQNDELSNIADHMKDAQAASEMAAEAIENKGNQIIGSLNNLDKGLKDVVAGTELTSEAVERVAVNTQATTGAARAISAKISKLTDMLAEKLSSEVKKSPSTQESTTLAALQDAMPIQVEQPKLEELIAQLLPQNPIPEDAPFLPPPTPQEETENKKDKNKKADDAGFKMDDLLKITKGGFKAVVSVSDKIASMLFKYTVTALANAAKFAAQMFALVLGIDMIQVYFQYFMKQFEAGWKEFNDKFKEWGPILEGLMTFAKNAQTMFSEKNWIGLATAIVKGMVSLTENMANLLMLGIGKLTAAMLRALGFSDAADNVEGSSLMTYQQKTGATLDDQDQTTLAKYQDRKDAEEFEGKKKAASRFKDKDKGLEEAKWYGSVSKETADEISAGGIDSSFRDMPEEQRLDIIKKRNNAQADIIRLTKTAEDIMKPDAVDKKNAKESYEDIQKQLNDPALKAAPKDLNMEQLIDKMNKSLEKFNDQPALKPQPVEQREETQQAKRVDEGIKAKASSVGTPAGTGLQNLVQQVNVQKNSKTQYNVPPQSATPAPGMHNATRVN